MWTKEQATENQPDFCIAASNALIEIKSDNKIMRDVVIISDLEPGGAVMNECSSRAGAKGKENKSPRSPYAAYESLSISPKVPRINNNPPSMEILSFDISMIKDNTGSVGSASSLEYNRKHQHQHCSPNGSKRQCCSTAMADKSREVDTFHGFESVFSFL